jgi:hypothetical protein
MSDPATISFLPTVRPMRTNADFHALHEAAAADNHRVIAATHMVEKDNAVVGYCSLGAATPMLVWLDAKKVRARDSLYLLNMAENLAANAGTRTLLVPCQTDSPFHPFMEKFGYQNAGKPFDLFLKQL